MTSPNPSRFDTQFPSPGRNPGIDSNTSWLSPPMVTNPGDPASSSNSIVLPDRGAATMTTGRSKSWGTGAGDRGTDRLRTGETGRRAGVGTTWGFPGPDFDLFPPPFPDPHSLFPMSKFSAGRTTHCNAVSTADIPLSRLRLLNFGNTAWSSAVAAL